MELNFHAWHEVFLTFRIQMARKGLCVTRHGWFTQSMETDMVEMIQNG